MSTPIWRGTIGLLESPRSPSYSFGETVEMVREFSGPFATALLSAAGKGTLGSGVAAGWKVDRSTVTKDRGQIGVLRIEYSPDTFTPPGSLPSDEWSLPTAQTDVALAKHPRYASLSTTTIHDIDVYLNVAPSDVSWINAQNRIANLPDPTQALAWELVTKQEKGVRTYAVYSPQVRQVIYSYEPPAVLSAGNFRQTPPTGPITIPGNLQWLRLADTLTDNGTYW